MSSCCPSLRQLLLHVSSQVKISSQIQLLKHWKLSFVSYIFTLEMYSGFFKDMATPLNPVNDASIMGNVTCTWLNYSWKMPIDLLINTTQCSSFYRGLCVSELGRSTLKFSNIVCDCSYLFHLGSIQKSSCASWVGVANTKKCSWPQSKLWNQFVHSVHVPAQCVELHMVGRCKDYLWTV